MGWTWLMGFDMLLLHTDNEIEWQINADTKACNLQVYNRPKKDEWSTFWSHSDRGLRSFEVTQQLESLGRFIIPGSFTSNKHWWISIPMLRMVQRRIYNPVQPKLGDWKQNDTNNCSKSQWGKQGSTCGAWIFDASLESLSEVHSLALVRAETESCCSMSWRGSTTSMEYLQGSTQYRRWICIIQSFDLARWRGEKILRNLSTFTKTVGLWGYSESRWFMIEGKRCCSQILQVSQCCRSMRGLIEQLETSLAITS